MSCLSQFSLGGEKKKREIAYREKLGIRVVQTLFCLLQSPLPPNLLPSTHSPSFLNISSSKTNHRAQENFSVQKYVNLDLLIYVVELESFFLSSQAHTE